MVMANVTGVSYAYRWHPDRNAGSVEAQARFQAILEAFQEVKRLQGVEGRMFRGQARYGASSYSGTGWMGAMGRKGGSDFNRGVRNSAPRGPRGDGWGIFASKAGFAAAAVLCLVFVMNGGEMLWNWNNGGKSFEEMIKRQKRVQDCPKPKK